MISNLYLIIEALLSLLSNFKWGEENHSLNGRHYDKTNVVESVWLVWQWDHGIKPTHVDTLFCNWGSIFFKGDLIKKMKKKISFELFSNIILNPNDQNDILHAKIELIEIKWSGHIKFQVMRDILGLRYTWLWMVNYDWFSKELILINYMFISHRFKPKTKINPNKLDEVEKQAKNSGTLIEN